MGDFFLAFVEVYHFAGVDAVAAGLVFVFVAFDDNGFESGGFCSVGGGVVGEGGRRAEYGDAGGEGFETGFIHDGSPCRNRLIRIS
ncbi:hypothetical protein CGZ77_04860 [Neisseria sp. KEM232]|nr:hypothetical protein CGZ77_04860 [Neisseria sp. KEM232]